MLTSVTDESRIMSYLGEVRAAVLNTITATVPLTVWSDLGDGVPWAYAEAFDSNKLDPRVLPQQARFKATNDRHFFMEHAISRVADHSGATFIPEVVEENGWRFGLFKSGKLCFTQKYVLTYGGMPTPAKFRKRLAEANKFTQQTRMFFMQGAAKVSDVEINAILVHCPENRDFNDETEGFRRPAFVTLAVPFSDYSDWAARFDLSELIASYATEEASRKAPAPKWKPIRKTEDGEGA